MIFFTAVGYFITIIRIHTLVLFLSCNTMFRGIFLKLGNGRHVVILTVINNNTNDGTPLVEILLLPQIYNL